MSQNYQNRIVALATTVSLTIFPLISSFAWAAGTMDKVQEYKLPTGQTLYIKENHDQPIVTIDTWVKTGSVNESAANNGVSHFLEHLIFKGTQKYKAGEIDRILESKGSEFNAATSDDYTHFYITTATPFFEDALKLHADMLIHATVPPNELTQERKVVQEEINRALDNPEHKQFHELGQLLYGKHPYAMDTLGPKSNIANIPRDSILSYYHQWYQPGNVNTVIVGDIKPEKALALVKANFSDLTNNPKIPVSHVSKPLPLKEPKVKVLTDPAIHQEYFTLAFLGPSIEEREDMYAMDVAMMVLGAGKSSRLYQALVEKQPLVNGVSAGNSTQKYTGVLYVDAELNPDNQKVVKDEIIRQLKELKQNGITEAELEKAKTQIIKDYVFHNESTDNVANRIGYSVTIGNLKDYTDYVSHIQKLSQADILKALNKYLDFNKAVIVEQLPASNTETKAQEAMNLNLLRAAAQSETLKVHQVAENGSAITKEKMPNGMTLLLKPRKDTGTVAIKIYVKGGQGIEPIPGLASMMASLMTKGTDSRTAEALNKELESKGIALSVSAQNDYFEVSGNSVKDDLGELFLALQDIMTRPTFAQEEIEKQKALMKDAIHASQDNPSSVSLENLTMALYPLHPYGNVGKRIEPHLSLIKREDLEKFFNCYFVPQNMIVSVVGNFEPDVIRTYLTAAFPSERYKDVAINSEMVTAEPVSPIKETKVLDDKKPIQGATWVTQGWLAPGIDSTDYMPMKVLNSVLGSGMSSRLFEDLRKKQGLAYVVSSFFPSQSKESHFVLYIGTDPKNKAAVLKGFQEEIARLKTEVVSEKELQIAKDKLAGQFALAHETNGSQAFYLGMYEALGAGYEFDQAYPKLVQKVTAEDIQRVANKYFSQPSITAVVEPSDTPAPVSQK